VNVIQLMNEEDETLRAQHNFEIPAVYQPEYLYGRRSIGCQRRNNFSVEIDIREIVCVCL